MAHQSGSTIIASPSEVASRVRSRRLLTWAAWAGTPSQLLIFARADPSFPAGDRGRARVCGPSPNPVTHTINHCSPARPLSRCRLSCRRASCLRRPSASVSRASKLRATWATTRRLTQRKRSARGRSRIPSKNTRSRSPSAAMRCNRQSHQLPRCTPTPRRRHPERVKVLRRPLGATLQT